MSVWDHRDAGVQPEEGYEPSPRDVAVRPACEACGTPLCAAGSHKTGVCSGCRQLGSAFALDWAVDLRAAGNTYTAIADVIGSTPNAVHARLSERRRGLR